MYNGKIYTQKNFTEEGMKMFNNYLVNLLRLYYSDKTYPLKTGIVYGLPFSETGVERIINSREEMLGRIKMLMQLLGKREVTFEFGANTYTFKIDNKNTKVIKDGN